MSLRYEQYNALKKSRAFLSDLLTPKTRPQTVAELRRRVWSCLKHFPLLDEKGQPYWSPDEFTEDRDDREDRIEAPRLDWVEDTLLCGSRMKSEMRDSVGI